MRSPNRDLVRIRKTSASSLDDNYGDWDKKKSISKRLVFNMES